jgi:hypothetical protein
VILQEIGQALDTPDDIIFDWLQEVAFPEQPWGAPSSARSSGCGGSTARFRPLRGGALRAGEMILSAAGAVDHGGDPAPGRSRLRAPEASPSARAEPGTFAGGEKREVKDLEQAHFTLALEAPGYRSDDIYTAQIYATALGGGMSSRLFQEIRERRGLCYTIYARSVPIDDTGMLTIYAGTSGEQIGGLVDLTLDELRRSAEDMSAAELDRARAQMKAGLLMGLESPSARAERQCAAGRDLGPGAAAGGDHRADRRRRPCRMRDHAASLVASGRAGHGALRPVAGRPDIARIRERLAA